MNELALFAGVGGGSLATKHLLGWRTVCYVEWEQYCVDVLKARIADSYLDDAPIWDDARTFDGRPWRGCVDIITAGFPCQPFSTAGKRKGASDKRNMWPDTIRIIREVRPSWVLLENVRGLLSAMDKAATFPHPYFGTILGDLAQSGYDARWRVLSAAEVGAPHKRDRPFVFAYTHGRGCQPDGECRGMAKVRAGGANVTMETPQFRADVAHIDSTPARYGHNGTVQIFTDTTQKDEAGRKSISETKWWDVEPAVGRVANGVASRVDRLKAIGNGQVPLVVATVWGLLTNEHV